MRLENLRFFDPSQSPAVRGDPAAVAHARAVSKAEELIAEAAEAFKLLQEDAVNGLLDLPPPVEPASVENPGASPAPKVSRLAVAWAADEPPDPTLGRVVALDAFLETKKAEDLLTPLRAAKASAAKAAKSAIKSTSTLGRKAGGAPIGQALVPGATHPLDAPVAAADRPKFETGLKALRAALSALGDDEDKANGQFYLHAFEKVSFAPCFCFLLQSLCL